MIWQPHIYLPSLKGLTTQDRQDWEKEYSNVLLGKSDDLREDFYLNTLFQKQFSTSPLYAQILSLPNDLFKEARNLLLSVPEKDKKAYEYAQLHGIPKEDLDAAGPEFRAAFVDKIDLTNDINSRFENNPNYFDILNFSENNLKELLGSSYKSLSEWADEKRNARNTLEKQLTERSNFLKKHPFLQTSIQAGMLGHGKVLNYNGSLYSDPVQTGLILNFYDKYGEKNDESLYWSSPALGALPPMPQGAAWRDNQKILEELKNKDLELKINSTEILDLLPALREEYNNLDEGSLRRLVNEELLGGEKEEVGLDGEKYKTYSPSSAYLRAYGKTPAAGEKALNAAQSVAGWTLEGATIGDMAGSLPGAAVGAATFGTWGTFNATVSNIWGLNYYLDNMKKEELVDVMSKVTALKNLYGENVAIAAADKEFREWITDKQTFFDKNQNIGNGIFVGGVANLANKAMAAEASILSWYDKEKAAAFLKGKDEEGNDLPLWNNPVYWNEVDLAGSFRKSDIEAFHETGGLSKYLNLYEVENGWKLNLDHGAAMGKFLWSDYATLKLAGNITKATASGIGAGIGKLTGSNPVKYVKMVEGNPVLTDWWDKNAFLGTETSAATRMLAQALPAFATNWFSVGGISLAYGMQTFANIQMLAEALIDEYLNKVAKEEALKEMASEDMLLLIDEITNSEIEKLKNSRPVSERDNPSLLDPSVIRESIANLILYSKMQKYKELHKNDEAVKEIEKRGDLAALAAYKADVLQEQVAMCALNYYSPRKMLMNKSFRAGFLADPASKLRTVVRDGKVVVEGNRNGFFDVVFGPKASIRKSLATTAWAGFESNFHDDVRVDIATGIGLDLLNDKTDENFDIENKLFLWGDILGSIGEGIGYAKDHYFDKQHFIDGWIGLLGSVMQVSPNLKGFTPKGRAEFVELFGGRRPSVGEWASFYIHSPALIEYLLTKAADEAVQILADAINQAIEKNLPILNNIMGIVNIARGAGLNNKSKKELLDDRQNLVVDYAIALDALTTNPDIYELTGQIEEVKSIYDRFRHLTEDNLSDSEKKVLVQLYLAEEGNEAERLAYQAADNVKKEVLESQIVSTIQESAKDVKETLDYLQELRKTIAENPTFNDLSNNAKNILYEHGLKLPLYKKRAALLEEKISGSSENTGVYMSSALYSNEEGYKASLKQAKIEAKRSQRRVEEAKKLLENYKKYWDKYLEKQTKEGHILSETEKNNHIKKITSLQLKIEALQARATQTQRIYDRTVADKGSLEAIFERVLSEEEILRLSPELRFRMFLNFDFYSEKLQEILKEIAEKLAGTNFMTNLFDSWVMHERATRTQEALDRMQANPEAINIFVDSTIKASYDNAINAMRRYSVHNIEDTIALYIKNKYEYYKRTDHWMNTEEIKKTVLSLVRSILILEDYAHKHKEDKSIVLEIIDNRELANTIREKVKEVSTSDNIQKALLNIVTELILSDAKNKIDIILKFREYALNGDIPEEQRELYKKVLNNLSLVEKLKEAITLVLELEEFADKELPEEIELEEETSEEINEEETVEETVEENNEIAEEETLEETNQEEQELTEDEEIELAEDTLAETETVTPEGNIEDIVGQLIAITTDEGRASTPDVDTYAKVGGNLFATSQIDETDTGNNLDYSSTSDSYYWGNIMRAYDTDVLRDSNLEIKREGREKNDSLNQFNKFLEVQGIKYLDIIDYELSQLYAKNHKLKIQFMMLRPDKVEGKDRLDNFVFNVTEYTPEVERIHIKERGGIIKSGGKLYLIVGTTGYENTNEAQRRMFLNLKDRVKYKANDYFHNNSEELFFVTQDMYSHIRTITTGYVVRQAFGDTSTNFRDIQTLLNDKERNPNNIGSLNNLGWCIRKKIGVLLYPSRIKAFIPKDVELNVGNTFVLVPNGKGSYTPLKTKAVYYKKKANSDELEIRPGKLADSIYDALIRVSSEDYGTRALAITQLVQRLYMPKKEDAPGPTILIGNKDSKTITVINRSGVRTLFELGANFDRNAFIKAVQLADFRINVTPGVIADTVLRKMYDEAGIFTTDAAKLGTSGVDYSIYPVGENGEPIVSEVTINLKKQTHDDSRYLYRISFLGTTYRKVNNIWENEFHLTVDTSTKEGYNIVTLLECNMWLEKYGVPMAEKKGNNAKFIINEKEGRVWNKNLSSQVITELSKTEGEAFIKAYKEKILKELRERQAKEALNKAKLNTVEETASVNNEEMGILDIITQEQVEQQALGIFEDTTEEVQQETETTVVPQTIQPNINNAATISLKDLDITKKSVNFADIIASPESLGLLCDACERKGISLEGDLRETLRSKGFPVDAEFGSVEEFIKNIDCYY